MLWVLWHEDESVFSTKQALHIYYGLTVSVITESLVRHFELKQYQLTRVLEANSGGK